ncbi:MULTISPECIES: dTDP-4-dehydrorhamnose reductase [Flavobacterium]|uniref:dTDP-4-dehydrorhamnose reductase n=1 Tax=Flavobacterium jumunjinense TaxID=998845 RepID=A0ABV5GQY8_9FLAO|nr:MULTISPECIES: dTDP-4-dehydrorhamnose reductase [Flavobacterium]
MVVLVTGANGQLGQALQSIYEDYPEIQFVFSSSSELDITKQNVCSSVFKKIKPNYCINTAAYTAVDKAEVELKKAFEINVKGVENLANVCKEYNTILIHISTDFVFDGQSSKAYTEKDIPNPKGVYGRTKLDGEQKIQNNWDKHFIIRTSWVYSQFGNNFMKTMIRLGNERESLLVVNDQIGTPTNAVDLSRSLIKIILFPNDKQQKVFGIYNFSNEGFCSWFDFAKEIFKINNIQIDLKPISTLSYPTPAERPKYSVLDKTKIKTIFDIEINDWKDSLYKHVQI